MMKPIYEFQTIQVELTNACVHSCSNCTRFCGHHKKTFFMDWDTFKKSIDTLKDWPRTIGIMGGEPTLHPEFERFVRYANEQHPMQYNIGGGHKPIQSLSKYMIDANGIKTGALNKFKGLGLWSSVCDKYYEHYELIQDSFIYQCINDHTASSRHQAWLMTRKEFGIGDEEWIEMRDNCWWQRLLGSPSVTPKGAFFCEVAAAMDMLFDGPGGWKIEKDWWKRGPEDYKDQLKWCEFCSGAFHSFDRDANEMVDDVSPFMYEKLKEIGSPKLKKPGAICVHPMGSDCDIEIKPRKNMLLYQPDQELRFTDKNKCLYPRQIVCVMFIHNMKQICNEAIESLAAQFDKIIIGTHDREVQRNLEGKYTVLFSEDSDLTMLTGVVRKAEDWIAMIEPQKIIETDLRIKIDKTIFNPGTLHIFQKTGMMFFNVRAKSLRDIGFDGVKYLENIEQLISVWPVEKIAVLDEKFDEVIEPDYEEWVETITKQGVMNWNYLRGVMDDMAVRRRIMPEAEKIMSRNNALKDRLQELDHLKLTEASDEAIINKIKTLIHNAIGQESNTKSLHAIKQELETVNDSFCVNYALAMLTMGKEKEERLARCILNPKNTYKLGWSTLKIHLNTFYRRRPLYEEPLYSIAEDILHASADTDALVIVGNKYTGKSIEMILERAGRVPKCFADDDRQGFGFHGLRTLSFLDACKEFPFGDYLLSECKDAEDRYLLGMEKAGYKGTYRYLHPVTIAEMGMTSGIRELGITEHIEKEIKKIHSEDEHACLKVKEFLLQ